MIIPQEVVLFKLGIKPAILLHNNLIDKYELDKREYYEDNFRGNIILSHEEIPKIQDYDNVKLGIVLGYYPKACELLFTDKERYEFNEFINFCGICFNTANLFTESFDWCMEQYSEKILENYQSFYCIQTIRNGIGSNKQVKTNKILITRDGCYYE